MSDSLLVLRLDVRSRKIDTVAAVKALDNRLPQSGSRGLGIPFPRPVPFSPTDAWAVAADGRIALARAAGPRVEWITAGRRLIRGPVIAFSPDRVTDADKRAFANRFGREELLVGTTTRRDGSTTTRVQRGWGEVGTSWFFWPDRKALFERDGLHVSMSGEAWLERAVPAGEPRVVDVFGPDAVWRRRIVLPRGRSIVGFGAGAVYLKVLSPSGKVTLERYRL